MTDVENKKSFKDSKLYTLIDSVIWLIIGATLAWLYMANVGFIGKIPSESMLPNYKVGDKIYVNRLGYVSSEPKRLDVIVFKSWEDPNDKYIKRVIGLPGDVIDIKDSNVIINGKILDERSYTQGNTEKLEDISLADMEYPLTIPDGHYFVMGDNRESSVDSRVYGLLKEEDIIGKYSFKLNK